MAVMLNKESNFLSTVLKSLGEPSVTHAQYQALVAYGVVFVVELYCIKATFAGNGWVLNLKTTTSTLIKHANDPSPSLDIMSARTQLRKFIHSLYEKIPAVPAASVPLPSDSSEDYAKEKDAKEVPVTNPLSDKVITLATATHLGQKVKGTSSGSIYRVVALHPRVRVAARLSGINLSIRAEGNFSDEDKALLVASGMTDHGSYASLHLDMQGMPSTKVLGAYLYGVGIPFSMLIKPGSEVPL